MPAEAAYPVVDYDITPSVNTKIAADALSDAILKRHVQVGAVDKIHPKIASVKTTDFDYLHALTFAGAVQGAHED